MKLKINRFCSRDIKVDTDINVILLTSLHNPQHQNQRDFSYKTVKLYFSENKNRLYLILYFYIKLIRSKFINIHKYM